MPTTPAPTCGNTHTTTGTPCPLDAVTALGRAPERRAEIRISQTLEDVVGAPGRSTGHQG